MRRVVLVLALSVLVSGCGFFRRTPNEFYSLETIRNGAPPRSIGGVPAGIDGIELPPGLDRRGIVVRGEDHRFEVRGTHQWAAPLEEMVIHTLAFDLASRLTPGMVVLPGQAKPAAMRSIYVVFEDLAAHDDGMFVLDARWVLAEPGAAERTGHERITVDMTSDESAAIAAAMSSALATFADRIAAAL